MSEGEPKTARVPLDTALLAQIEAIRESAGFASAEAFVHHCVEKELKAQREAAEKALAQRLRALGYLE
ncbi:MAG: hypothetical protein FJY95_11855 [Candidatus Handelsmanbacteria bacterium]|nr:hypothetical protein [Candidatus Handelsmanbacteria bacterium]